MKHDCFIQVLKYFVRYVKESDYCYNMAGFSSISEFTDKLTEDLCGALNYVICQYVEDNKEEIETAIKENPKGNKLSRKEKIVYAVSLVLFIIGILVGMRVDYLIFCT